MGVFSIAAVEGQVFGDAVFLGHFEDSSADWHEIRSQGVGGSDVAAICGVSKWSSAYALWAKKTGRISDDSGESEAMLWGKLLEPVIGAEFVRRHPELDVDLKPGSWASVERPWQIVNPDGIYRKADGSFGVLEIKTAAYEDDWQLGVPKYYRTQVQWYLQAFGFSEARVMVLFRGNKPEEFVVPADEFEQSVNLSMVEEFVKCWRDDVPPAWDGSASTLETVRAQHPEIVDGQVDLGELGVDLLVKSAEFEFAQERLNEVKSQVLNMMGKVRHGVVVNVDGDEVKVATRMSRKGGQPFLVVSKNV